MQHILCSGVARPPPLLYAKQQDAQRDHRDREQLKDGSVR